MLVRALSLICFIQTCFIAATSKLIPSSDGTTIYANAVGNPLNPSLVFIHGLMLSGIVFDNLVQDVHLQSLFYLVTYDMRGHGRSDKPSDPTAYTSQLFANDFAAVSSAFNLKAPTVIGWSYGGTVFTDIFSYLPANSVSALVGIAALPYTSLQALGVNTATSLAYLPNFFVNDVQTYTNAKVSFVDSCFNTPANVPAETTWAWLGSAVTQYPPVTSILLSRPQDPTGFFAAGARGLPLLLIAGTNDMIVLNDVIINATVPHFTNVQVQHVQGSSHAVFFDNQTTFINLLIPFVTGVNPQ